MPAAVLTPDFGGGKGLQSTRIRSIDILRGLAMVLMAIDHVRVYSGMPAGGPTPGIFFTRWVTHFCVPTFVFFAGTSAFLYGEKLKNKNSLSRFLVTRGLFLVLLELTLLRFCWTFNFNYSQFILAGVIWMLGCCMVILALLVWLKPLVHVIVGLILVFFQQAFHYLPNLLPLSWQKSFDWFWDFIYPTGQEDHPGIAILYVLVPWIGVMMLGFGFGKILLMEAAKRKKICLRIGLAAIGIFILTDIIMLFLNPAKADQRPILFRFLDQKKYPPSPLYLLMTLGPLIALVPFTEKVRGRLADIFGIFGRVPLFYYLLHIPLIHLSALLVNFIRDGTTHQDWYGYAPFTEISKEQRWGLPLLYLVFLLVEVILYFACRSYSRYKTLHPEKKWLKYI